MQIILANIFLILFSIFSISFLFIACDSGDDTSDKEKAERKAIYLSLKDSTDKIDLILKDSFPRINYNYTVIRDKEHLDSIKLAFAETEENPALNKMFCTLNRKERRFLRIGDTVVFADDVVPNMVAYSVFPFYYPGGKNLKKLVIVSAKYQAYCCYEYGKQVRFAATNTGKERTPSYPGRYAMVWRQELRISSLDSTWKMPYTWNIHKYSGSAFHKFDMPGYPASHSCMRQFMDDAKWLYKWGKGEKFDSVRKTSYMTGTPVIIIDHFDFTPPRRKPWISLRSNKDVFLKLPDDPMQVEEALIPLSQIPHVSRGSLRNRNRYIYAEDTLRARGIIRQGVEITASVNFNKLRRQKRERRAKELELKKKQEEEKLNIISQPQ
jgi:hypothetical protein